jgi:hypothetical protein
MSQPSGRPRASTGVVVTLILLGLPQLVLVRVVSRDPQYTVSLLAQGLQLPDGEIIYRPATNDLLVTEENLGHISSVNASAGAVTSLADITSSATLTRHAYLHELNIKAPEKSLYGLFAFPKANVISPVVMRPGEFDPDHLSMSPLWRLLPRGAALTVSAFFRQTFVQ